MNTLWQHTLLNVLFLQSSMPRSLYSLPLDVVVGLNKTKQVVRESVGVVDVCAIVYSPNATNRSFPFDVRFIFNGDSASME